MVLFIAMNVFNFRFTARTLTGSLI